ncbi:transcription repressor OFP2 [Ricinus communis]|uniref:transcription repressor OFP2 n=1 Tax=Ricinus communis TaxID=3988 RepID=UPI00201ADCA0|nr:transcription repressor OFP2 [Ricinus communis]
MPLSKTNKLFKTVLGAGCSCARPKPSDVHEPKTTISLKDPNPSSSLSSYDKNGVFSIGDGESCTSITATIDSGILPQLNSESDDTNPKRSNKITNSIAVVKDSNDPYQDFKHSMLQMIFEKEIYSADDLQELLNCFLKLNSPRHHGLIVQAFTEIWNDVISKKLMDPQKPSVPGE